MTFPSSVVPRLLEGRLALITGAGQGNGRAIALGPAQAGARVVATDMNESAAEETAKSIRSAGGEAWAFVLDVTAPAACEALPRWVAYRHRGSARRGTSAGRTKTKRLVETHLDLEAPSRYHRRKFPSRVDRAS